MSRLIETTYGKVSGVLKNGCMEYLGIPYAKPPVGDLAFRHPLPPESWDGALKADHPPKNPIQAMGGFGMPDNSEDCLYLNIFKPDTDETSLPVMVWVYGGSYSCGGIGRKQEGSDTMMYELGLFAKETNTVVVAVNYRLNVYGFLNLHALSDRFDRNNGLYDLKLALEFVRDNINAFGGDPDNVTVFGQSAGGALTLALMTSEKTKHLFHKAIVQSANAEHFWTEDESKKLCEKYLKLVGMDRHRPEDILQVPYDRIRQANLRFEQQLIFSGTITCGFSPVIDGDFLEDYPVKLMAKSDKPLLMGCTKAEADLFIEKMNGFILRAIPMATHIKPVKGTDAYKQRMSDGLTDYMYKKPIREIIASYPGKNWVYEFVYVTKEYRKRGLRACHTAELPVLFGLNWENECTATEPGVAHVGVQMRQCWKEFAWGHFAASELLTEDKMIRFGDKE